MNTVAKEVSQTPITDAAAGCTPSFDDGDRCVHVDVARKLETDRAALIAALAEIAGYDNGFGTLQEFARATLAKVQA